MCEINEYNEPGFINYENVKLKRVGDNLFKVLHGEMEGELVTYDTLNMYYIPVDSKKYDRPWILTKVRIVEMKYSDIVRLVQEEIYESRDKFDRVDRAVMRQHEIRGALPQHVREQLFTEAMDEKKLRKLIRAELAAWLFDLFKKRSVWI